MIAGKRNQSLKLLWSESVIFLLLWISAISDSYGENMRAQDWDNHKEKKNANK